MAHMINKSGEFRRGFGRGPKRNESKPQEKPGGRDVLIPIGRLDMAIRSKHMERCSVDPRLASVLRAAVEGAKEKGIDVSGEAGSMPYCPNSVIASAIAEADRLLLMNPKRLATVIGKREANELREALERTKPNIVGMKRLLCT